MSYASDAPDLVDFRLRRSSRHGALHAVLGAAVLTLGVVAGGWLLANRQAVEEPQTVHAPAVAAARAPATSNVQTAWLDPASSSGAAPVLLAENAPLSSDLEWSTPIAPAEPAMAQEPAAVQDAVLPLPEPAVPPLVASVPLPAPRPPQFDLRTDQGPVRLPGRQASRMRTAAAPLAPADNRGFFEKLFGVSKAPGPLLAYAAPEPTSPGNLPSFTAAPAPDDRATAVYDIAAHTVYMPDGTRLEAHSGLGNRLDDPRYVHERMRGATPPHVYDLALRAQLFHGVRALRLTPVDGGRVYGRTGLLAHTFMLGPNGDSNGCVSFRNYEAFLQAFQSGGVKRLAVVARRT